MDTGFELFGGVMSLAGIVLFFLAVIWFILPFVVLGIRGRIDRALDLLESLDRRLAALERRLSAEPPESGTPPCSPPSGPPPAAPPE